MAFMTALPNAAADSHGYFWFLRRQIEIKIGVLEFLGSTILTASKIAFRFDFETIENVFKSEIGNYITNKYFRVD